MSLPSREKRFKIIEELKRKIEKGEILPAKLLPKDAPPLDCLKHSVCRKILLFKKRYDMTLDEMGKIMGISKHEVSRVINYHFERISLDRLIRFYDSLVEHSDDAKMRKAFDKEVRAFLNDENVKFG